jgi:hypothetical protein
VVLRSIAPSLRVKKPAAAVVMEPSTSGTVPNARSSRHNRRNRHSHARRSHGNLGNHRSLGNREQQLQLAARC